MDERNLDLVVRNENTRDKFQTEVVRFELDQILQHFVEAIQTINAQFWGIIGCCCTNTVSEVLTWELFRWDTIS